MLKTIQTTDDSYFKLLADDPVRPTIPHEIRIVGNKKTFCLCDDSTPRAVVCVSFHDSVPRTEADLFIDVVVSPTIAVFYTVWSYAPRAGRQIIFEVVREILATMPTVNRFITLSPKSEMARRFHTNNGAVVLSENDETINYEYAITS